MIPDSDVNTKLQTEPCPEHILRQLQEEPRVLLRDSVHRRTSKSQTAPDLSHIAHFEECSTSEIFPENTSNKPKKNWKKCYDESKDNVEGELRKMFQDFEKETTIDPSPIKTFSRKNKKSKKQPLRELLIQLFGSPLDDISCEDTKLKRVKISGRRNTLPVSLNLSQKVLDPLKVTLKRKSASDVDIISSKVPRTELSVNVSSEGAISVPFTRACDLFIPPVFTETAKVLHCHNDFDIAFVSNLPCVQEGKIAKNMNCTPVVIDLTEDGADVTSKPYEHSIKLDKDVKAPCFSEQACVPVSTIVCSVPGPISPAEPTPAETVNTKSLQGPPPMRQIQDLPENQKHSMDKSVLHNPKTSSTSIVQATYQTKPPPYRNPPIQRETERLIRQNSGGSITIQQQTTSPGFTIHHPPLNTAAWCKQPVPAMEQAPRASTHMDSAFNKRPTQQQMLNQNSPQVHQILQQNVAQKAQNLNTAPYPQLTRLYRYERTPLEFELITNSTCAEKIFPHIHSLVQWRIHIANFFEKMKLIVADAKPYEGALYHYCVNFTELLGLKLIKDFANVDVQNFSFCAVLSMISKSFLAYHCTVGIYQVCSLINIMMTPSTAYCQTPFLKKLYCNVKVTLEKLEEKYSNVPALFTTTQLKLLQDQIHEYLRISQWLKTNWKATLTQPPTRPKRQYNKKAKTINVLEDTVVRSGNPAKRLNFSPASAKQTDPTCLEVIVNGTVPVAPQPSQSNQTASTQILLASSKTIVNRNIPTAAKPLQPPTQAPTSYFDARNSNIPIAQKTYQSGFDRQNVQGNNNARPVQTQLPSYESSTAIPQTSVIVARNPHLGFEANKGHHANNRTTLTEKPVASPTVSSNTVPEISSDVSNLESYNQDTQAPETVVDNEDIKHTVGTEDDVSSTTVKTDSTPFDNDEIIDLTWIDDVDEAQIMEEIIETKSFPFKIEEFWEKNEAEDMNEREVISPSDSGVGSPAQLDNVGFKCFCGNRATFVCSCCNSAMYCSRDCQEKDWVYHQPFCHKS